MINWRDKSPAFYDAVTLAHYLSAKDTRVASTAAFVAAAAGSGSFASGVAAGVSAFGKFHAPITAARVFLFCGGKPYQKPIPGWGNSFHKDGIAPQWREAYYFAKKELSFSQNQLVREVNIRLGPKGIYPNAAFCTAVLAEVCGVPPNTELALAIPPRVTAWAEMFNSYQKEN